MVVDEYRDSLDVVFSDMPSARINDAVGCLLGLDLTFRCRGLDGHVVHACLNRLYQVEATPGELHGRRVHNLWCPATDSF